MNNSDLYVTERTEASIDELSLAVRDVLGFGNHVCPDLLSALENDLTKHLPHFGLVPVADGSLGFGKIAKASYDPYKIELENSGYKRLGEFDPNARFDVAHELGHLFLHYDGNQSLPKFRTAGNVVFVKKRSMSGEAQADRFGTSFLVPAHVAREFESWEDIAEWCKVPASVAREAYRQHGRRMSRPVHPTLQEIFDDLNK